MPTPILKIPVDDGAFQRYLASYKKYQTSLRAQPGLWKTIGAAIRDTASSGSAMADEIERQSRMTEKLTQQEEKREEALREAAKRREEEDKEQEKRRSKALQQVKDYSRSLMDAAVSFGKWSLFGGATGVVGSALGLWGLDRIAEGAAGQYRNARGMGVSIGQSQGANLTLQRYFDVNSVMGNIANMQANPSQWGTFRMMGINPQGMDPNELTYRAAAAARRMFIADKGNLALAQAQGLTNIFSPEDLRRMANEKSGDFNKQLREGRQFQGMSDEVGRKWQTFSQTLDKAKLQFENTLVTGLSKVALPLGELAEGLGKMAVHVIKSIDWDAVGKGIETFSKYITSPQFQGDFQKFWDGVVGAGHALWDLMKLLGYVHGDQPSDTGAGAEPGNGVNRRTVKSLGPLGKVIDETPAMEYATKLFRGWGWKDHQIKGLLANIDQESRFNPFAVGDNGKAYGIGQWHADRQARYEKWAGHTMQSVRDPKQALNEQLRFMQYDLNRYETVAKQKLLESNWAASAGYAVSRYYERQKDDRLYTNAIARGALAQTITLKVENKTGASVSTTANSAAGGK